jgi:hypothetical protein
MNDKSQGNKGEAIFRRKKETKSSGETERPQRKSVKFSAPDPVPLGGRGSQYLHHK